MPSATRVVRLPDLFERWPIPRAVSPKFDEIDKESVRWFESFEPFDARTLAALRKCKFGLLSGLAYPHASREIVRLGCDLMQALFMHDEISDQQSAAEAQKGGAIIMDTLRYACHSRIFSSSLTIHHSNPYDPRPQDEPALGVVWQR